MFLTQGGKSVDEQVPLDTLDAITKQNIIVREGELPLFEIFPSNRHEERFPLEPPPPEENVITVELTPEQIKTILPLCTIVETNPDDRKRTRDEVNIRETVHAAEYLFEGLFSDSQFFCPKSDRFPFLRTSRPVK